ncbi:hypothetical protein BH11PLA1_BH11PLA1_09600 [soil metagenome]
MTQKMKLILAGAALGIAFVIMLITVLSNRSVSIPPPNSVVEFSAKLNLHDNVRNYYIAEHGDSAANTVLFDGVVEKQSDIDAIKARVDAINPKPKVEWNIKVGKLPAPFPIP